jgi:hypothetical protein
MPIDAPDRRSTSQPVSDAAGSSLRLSRRALLKAGVAGAVALVLARWVYRQAASPTASAAHFVALDGRARSVVVAIVPVMLESALPTGEASMAARDEVVAGVDRAIAGLPPAVRGEVEELFSLLAFAPTRCLVAGVWMPWAEASPDVIARFLDRWQHSRFALLRSAYEALHRLILAAWYGNARAWPAIGYPGPPSLDAA